MLSTSVEAKEQANSTDEKKQQTPEEKLPQVLKKFPSKHPLGKFQNP
jgi:hypothetical protein